MSKVEKAKENPNAFGMNRKKKKRRRRRVFLGSENGKRKLREKKQSEITGKCPRQ
jgi:hypothetical protein